MCPAAKQWYGKDLEGIRAAARVGREVLDAGHAVVKPGVTTAEIDRVVHEATISRGAYPSDLNYYSFPKSVCISVNEVSSFAVDLTKRAGSRAHESCWTE